jgi:Uma2 family endonuclease
LNRRHDDGIVVGMEKRYSRRHRLTVDEYLEGPETMRPMELVDGIVREPPAPFGLHQSLVTQLTVQLYQHVGEHRLGEVFVSPLDVVLDRERALVVQPDILFIAQDRHGILDRCVWGAPDLVVEVLSSGTARRDRTTKVNWYDEYGVRECWLVDPLADAVDVLRFGPTRRCRRFTQDARVESDVLPAWSLTARAMLGDRRG